MLSARDTNIMAVKSRKAKRPSSIERSSISTVELLPLSSDLKTFKVVSNQSNGLPVQIVMSKSGVQPRATRTQKKLEEQLFNMTAAVPMQSFEDNLNTVLESTFVGKSPRKSTPKKGTEKKESAKKENNCSPRKTRSGRCLQSQLATQPRNRRLDDQTPKRQSKRSISADDVAARNAPIDAAKVSVQNKRRRNNTDKGVSASRQSSRTTSNRSNREWSEAELAKLKQAVVDIPTAAHDYWQAVANAVGTRNADDCCKMFNTRPDLQKVAHRNKTFTSLTKRPNQLSKNEPSTSAAVPAAAPAVQRVVTAGAGTMKRRQQIRVIVQQKAADNWQQQNDDALSLDGGGLTQSERNALLGNVGLSPSASQGAASANMSLITAGGAALSVLEDSNASVLSSAFEMPKSACRNNADKLVKKIRSKKAGPAGGSKKAKNAYTQKALCLTSLPILSGRLMVATSTPNVTIRSCDELSESTLDSTESSNP